MGTEQEVTGSSDSDDGTRSISFSQPATATSSQMMFESANFVSLPTEVTCAVLSQLHPADLLRFCRTSKDFRDMLMSESYDSITIWKSARESHGDVPEPMPGVSEFRWATWLFENPPCEVCGSRIPLLQRGPYLSVGHRVCKECFRKKCLFPFNVSREENQDVPDIELFSLSVPKDNGHEKPGFWAEDVNDVSATLRSLTRDIELDKHGAAQALEDYMDRRRELVRSSHQAYQDFKHWRTRDSPRVRSHNREELQSYIAALGYTWDDFMFVMRRHPRPFYDYLFTRDTELRHEEWKKEEPLVIEQLGRCPAEREAEHRLNVLADRWSVVTGHYKNYLQDLPPLRQAEAPPLAVANLFPGIDILVNSPSTDFLSHELSRAMRNIKEMIADYIEAKDMMCRDIAVQCLTHSDDHPPPHHLASFVIQCAQQDCFNRAEYGLRNRPLFGPADVRNHHCYSQPLPESPLCGLESRYAFSDRGREVVLSLLSLLGLEPHTTLPETLDRLSARFLCGNCPSIETATNESRYLYNWRQSVIHSIASDKETHVEFKWELLPDESAEDVARREKRSRETDTLDAGIEAWWCNHCNHTLENGEDRKLNVLAHICERHKEILSPEEGRDFFFSPAQTRSGPQPILYVVERAVTPN
ncbi:hypothetical protein CONPUDRAFT_168998 [Coniophora puteana RWD-64-598 SS2]|uniref:F-box domain-containing protein n=1 Tax=Coniophora puteana (strain RWD-64-598) TaxID=741705 RepID=A0A5M3MBT0_CONPW|nr:uncharacterized protein CONPUDRAFT_168998 [Coniophora puteana RWD-64-598 SS2]EIW76466.1 hypothetical protein CONPUDRAFT_168998 [Coniophora puteana RWD-64-598 SS2]